MLTPQEIQDKKFEKAMFGGYDMSQIDKFLDEVLVDYSSLYKENATLKAKMRVLVDKIEEYRAVDEEMRKALYTAQVTAKEITEKARAEAEGMLANARREADQQTAAIRLEVKAEERRLAEAKNANADYIGKIKDLMRRNIELMDTILDQPQEELNKKEKPKAANGRPAPRDDFQVVLPDEVMEGPGAPKPAPEAVPAATSLAESKTEAFDVVFEEPGTGKIADIIAQAEARAAAEAAAARRPGGAEPAAVAAAPTRAEGQLETQFYEVELGAKASDANTRFDDEDESDTAKIYGDATFTPKPRFDFSDMRFGKDYKEDDED